MKKFSFFLMTALVLGFGFSSCKEKEPDVVVPDDAVGSFKQADVIDLAASTYAAWEEGTPIPETFELDGKTLTIANYQFAICKALINLSEGKNENIIVLNYKPADHPERDNYNDRETIPIVNGPKNGEETEDLVNVATRMLARMAENFRVPNQTNFNRSSGAIAYSTDRATITISRALAAYKKDGKLPESISTDYKGDAATLKAFAKELVKYLDIWEKTVGTVDADGSHCTSNNTAWQNVHFIPIEYSGGYKDGTMYSEQYMPYYHPVVDNKEYTAAECWSIAAQGIMDLVTKEGSTVLQPSRNPFIHTMANGKSLKEPMPAPAVYATEHGFNAWPWYENTGDGPIINFSDAMPCTIEFIAHELGWYLTRNTQFDAPGAIGNFQVFGTGEGTINYSLDDSHIYSGTISAMRTFLIMIRFYKYLLDNNIDENVWDATKDVHLDYDLYGVDMPDISTTTKSLDIDSKGNEVTLKFTAKKDWTATASEAWIHIDPASGTTGDVSMKVTADENTGAQREGKITLKGGNVEALEIPVVQAKFVEPSKSTLKDFAKEFVKGLDVWAQTVGTVESEGKHLIENGTAWENVHFIPITPNPNCEYLSHAGNQYDPMWQDKIWKLNVNGEEITSSQAWEIAIRGLMNMVTTEGEAFLDGMTDRNKAYTLGNGESLSESRMPMANENNKWGNHPWYEGANTDLVTYNNQAIETVDVNFMVKVGAWHVVRAFIPVGSNSPLKQIGNYQEFGTSSGTLNLEGYAGLISPMREMLILMRIYKYMLDNNIDSNVYDALKDQKFDFDLYAQGTPAAPSEPKLKDFAEEFVKGLEVWQNTVGTVDADGTHCTANHNAWENVHFIPIVGNPNSDYYNEPGNQYDPKWADKIWKLNVKGTEYSSSQAWEIAIRGLLNMCTSEGEAFLDGMTDRNKAYTMADGKSLSTAPISEPSAANKWGKHPWYESNNLVKNGGADVTEVDVAFMLKVGAWHVVRSFIAVGSNNPLGMIGNFQEFGTSSGTLNLESYVGYISPMRELLIMMRIYKYLLDNNIDSNVYTAIKDKKFDIDLYGENLTPGGGESNTIKTAEEFLAWAADASKDAVLGADITLPETFTGVDTLKASFDGGNHTITYNMTYATKETVATAESPGNIGLFRLVLGSVKNLKVAGTLTANPEAGSGYYAIGAVAARTGENAVIENCVSDVNVLTTTKVTHYMAAMVGWSAPGTVIKGCTNNGKVELTIEGSSNASQLAGMVGHVEQSVTIENCNNNGRIAFDITGNGSSRVGGMVGYFNDPVSLVIKNCVNTAEIYNKGLKKDSYTYIGGMVGYYAKTGRGAEHKSTFAIENCSNSGKINGLGTLSTGLMRAGGIMSHIGIQSEGTIKNCVNTGDVYTECVNSKCVIGGVLAFGEETGIITCSGCKNAAKIESTGTTGGITGGLVGQTLSAASTFTDFTVTSATEAMIKGGTCGAVIGKAQNLTTALTGKVGAAKVIIGETSTVLTADNYKTLVVGAAMADGSSVEGVTFGE